MLFTLHRANHLKEKERTESVKHLVGRDVRTHQLNVAISSISRMVWFGCNARLLNGERGLIFRLPYEYTVLVTLPASKGGEILGRLSL